jgi:hypothetical protein
MAGMIGRSEWKIELNRGPIPLNFIHEPREVYHRDKEWPIRRKSVGLHPVISEVPVRALA